MTDAKREPIGYTIEPHQYEKLRAIMTRLYGDGTHITADQRRDLANTMDAVLHAVGMSAIYDTPRK